MVSVYAVSPEKELVRLAVNEQNKKKLDSTKPEHTFVLVNWSKAVLSNILFFDDTPFFVSFVAEEFLDRLHTWKLPREVVKKVAATTFFLRKWKIASVVGRNQSQIYL